MGTEVLSAKGFVCGIVAMFVIVSFPLGQFNGSSDSLMMGCTPSPLRIDTRVEGHPRDVLPLGDPLPPSANFSYAPLYPTDLETIAFTDTSYDPDGFLVAWSWVFGDGAVSSEQNPGHRFLDEGFYNVSLTVSDNQSLNSTVSKVIQVFNVAPIADFTYSINDTMVSFSAAGSTDADGVITDFLWVFGDGTNGSGMTVVHTYPVYSTYTVILTVVDDDGNSSAASENVSLLDLIPPELVDHTPSVGYTGAAFTFNATITDNDLVTSATVEYWYGAGVHTNESMANTAGDFWVETITLADTLDLLHYCLSAVDPAGNRNTTGVKNVTMIDNVSPSFLDDSPTLGTTGGLFTFNVSAFDNIGVASVKVTWTHGHMGGTNESLTPDGNGTWGLTIILDDNLSAMTYQITVTDTSQNQITGPQKSVQVTDNDKPVIVDHTASTAQAGDPFSFNATVTDNIRVESVFVEYWFDNATHTNLTMIAVGDSLWQRTIVVNLSSVILHYLISAKDSSGNWQRTVVKVVLISPDSPPGTPQAPTGTTMGKIKVEYTFNTTSIDPDGDEVYYLWSWGDGNTSGWLGPFASGENATARYTWMGRGFYGVKVKAKDTRGLESNWSHTVNVTMLGPSVLVGIITDKTTVGDYTVFIPFFIYAFLVSPLNITVYSLVGKVMVLTNESSGFIGNRIIIGVFYSVYLSDSQYPMPLVAHGRLFHRLHQRSH